MHLDLEQAMRPALSVRRQFLANFVESAAGHGATQTAGIFLFPCAPPQLNGV